METPGVVEVQAWLSLLTCLLRPKGGLGGVFCCLSCCCCFGFDLPSCGIIRLSSPLVGVPLFRLFCRLPPPRTAALAYWQGVRLESDRPGFSSRFRRGSDSRSSHASDYSGYPARGRTPVATPPGACRAPVATPTGACRTPVATPTGACRTPVATPPGACRAPVATPTGACRTPVATPTGACRTPVATPTGAVHQWLPRQGPAVHQWLPRQGPEGGCRSGKNTIPRCTQIFSLLLNAGPYRPPNLWPNGKATASKAADLGWISAFPRKAFSRSSHTSDVKTGSPVATLLGASRYRVTTGPGWPGVSIL